MSHSRHEGAEYKKPLRLRALTDDEVNFQNTFVKTKAADLEAAPMKKPRAEDIDKAYRRCLQDHDKIGNSEGDAAMLNMAQNMVNAGDGGGFSNSDAFVGNVKDLIPDELDEAAIDEEEEAAAEVIENGKGKKEVEAKPKMVWFDRDRLCNTARRDLQSCFEKTKADCENAAAQLSKHVETYRNLEGHHPQFYDGEIRIADTRLKGLKLVLSGTDVELKDYIKSFMNPEKLSAASSVKPSGSLGSAPPCQGYEKLILFTEWEVMIQRVLDAEGPKVLKERRREFLSHRSTFMVLQKSCQKAFADFEKAAKSLVMAKAPLPKPFAARDHAAAPAALPHMFDHGAATASAMRIIKEGETVALDEPFVIRTSDDEQNKFLAVQSLAAAVQSFAEAFDADPAKVTMLRAQQPVPSPIVDVTNSRGERLLPNGLVRAHGAPESMHLDDLMAPRSSV